MAVAVYNTEHHVIFHEPGQEPQVVEAKFVDVTSHHNRLVMHLEEHPTDTQARAALKRIQRQVGQ